MPLISTRNKASDSARAALLPQAFTARPRSGKLIAALALALATAALFAPLWQAQFLSIDDDLYVTENRRVRAGLTADNMVWAFTATEIANYWHPLTWASHMLDVELFGLSAGGHHLTSLLLHAVNAAILFLVLCELTGRTGCAFMVAGLFAFHPLHVESVAWISERKDVLSTLFWLLALGSYTRYARSGIGVRCADSVVADNRGAIAARQFPWYVLTLVAFLCALMSKPMAVTLPFVLLLLDYWPLERMASPATRRFGGLASRRVLLLEKLPFFAMSIAIAVIAFAGQRAGKTVSSIDAYPVSWRVGNAVVSYATYLWKTIWPRDLVIYYPHPEGTLSVGIVLAAGVVLGGITAVAFAYYRRMPALLVGWGWYIVTLLPVSGLVQIGTFARADRYTYIPLVGVFLAGTWSVSAGLARLGLGSQHMLPRVLAGLLLAVYAGVTHAQLRYWHDNRALYSHALRVMPSNAVAHDGLGLELSREGRWAEAAWHFERSLKALPGAPRTYLRLGVCYAGQGAYDDAVRMYDEALHYDPAFIDAYVNKALIQASAGRLGDAQTTLDQALRLDPDEAKVHAGLGLVMTMLARPSDAIDHFKEALRLEPDSPSILNNYGRCLLLVGRADEAVAVLSRLVALGHADATAYLNLAEAYAATQRHVESLNAAQQALIMAERGNQPAVSERARAWLQGHVGVEARQGAP